MHPVSPLSKSPSRWLLQESRGPLHVQFSRTWYQFHMDNCVLFDSWFLVLHLQPSESHTATSAHHLIYMEHQERDVMLSQEFYKEYTAFNKAVNCTEHFSFSEA